MKKTCRQRRRRKTRGCDEETETRQSSSDGAEGRWRDGDEEGVIKNNRVCVSFAACGRRRFVVALRLLGVALSLLLRLSKEEKKGKKWKLVKRILADAGAAFWMPLARAVFAYKRCGYFFSPYLLLLLRRKDVSGAGTSHSTVELFIRPALISSTATRRTAVPEKAREVSRVVPRL